MNKKTIIIGLIIAGVVIGGGFLYYNHKKKNDLLNSKSNMASKSDALLVADILGKKDTPLKAEQINQFVQLYTSSIDSDSHKKIVLALGKKESDWTSQEKLDTLPLSEKVLMKMISIIK